MDDGLMGYTVWMNSSSFFRVTSRWTKSRRELETDVLDDTRIHPENYDLARKMAADAMDIEEYLGDSSDANVSQHVEDIMQNPGKLDSLLLQDYAKVLEKQNGIMKLITLEDIKIELQNPYIERRYPFAPPTHDAVFTMLTGESDLTLQPEMLIPVVIHRIFDRFVSCRMPEAGLQASIPFRNLFDQDDSRGYYESPADVPGIVEQASIRAKVMAVQKDRFNVELSVKQSDLDKKSRSTLYPLDRYFDYEREQKELDAMQGLLWTDTWTSSMYISYLTTTH